MKFFSLKKVHCCIWKMYVTNCRYLWYVLFFYLFFSFSLSFLSKLRSKINASKFHTFGSSIFPFCTSSSLFFVGYPVFLVYHCNDYIFINLYHIPPNSNLLLLHTTVSLLHRTTLSIRSILL